MAVKKTMPQWQLDLLGLGLSVVGGGISSFAMTQADLKIKKFQEVPLLSPTANLLASSIYVFLVPAAAKPFGYGMAGVSGGSGADMAMNGLSRIEIQGDEIQGDVDNGEEQVDNLSRINEAIQEAARQAEETAYTMADGDGTD